MASVTKTKGNLSVRAHIGDSKTLLAFDLDKTATKNLAGFTVQSGPPGVAPYFILNELQFKTPTDHAQDATLRPTPASTRRSTSSGGSTCPVRRIRG